jgi:hypothetical protein
MSVRSLLPTLFPQPTFRQPRNVNRSTAASDASAGPDARQSAPAIGPMSEGLEPISLGPVTASYHKTLFDDDDDIYVENTRKELAPLLRLVSWIFSPAATRQHVLLQIDAPTRGLFAVCDEVRLQRVFENFLFHALEFAPEHSTITIGARREGAEIRFWVSNEGPGIPLARQRELFARKNPTSSPFGRQGAEDETGLAACQRIVAAHGGTIQVQNRPEGGTCFEFCLSTTVDHPPALAAA